MYISIRCSTQAGGHRLAQSLLPLVLVTRWQCRSNATTTAVRLILNQNLQVIREHVERIQFVKCTPRQISNGNARLQAYLFTERRSKAARDLFNPVKLSFRERIKHNRHIYTIYMWVY